MKTENNNDSWLSLLYKGAKLEFGLTPQVLEKMRKQYEQSVKEYKQTGKIVTYENEIDEAKAKALRIAFEKLNDKEKYREEFNRNFKSIVDNFSEITPDGAVVGE